MPIFETIMIEDAAFGDTRESRKAALCSLPLIGSSFWVPNKDRAAMTGKYGKTAVLYRFWKITCQ